MRLVPHIASGASAHLEFDRTNESDWNLNAQMDSR